MHFIHYSVKHEHQNNSSFSSWNKLDISSDRQNSKKTGSGQQIYVYTIGEQNRRNLWIYYLCQHIPQFIESSHNSAVPVINIINIILYEWRIKNFLSV